MKNRVTIVISLITLFVACAARADGWPQWMGPGRDNVWHETGIIDKFPANGPPIRWRVPIGAGYSSPTIAGGRVFLIDRQVKEGAPKAPNPFARLSIPGVERVLCLNATD